MLLVVGLRPKSRVTDDGQTAWRDVSQYDPNIQRLRRIVPGHPLGQHKLHLKAAWCDGLRNGRSHLELDRLSGLRHRRGHREFSLALVLAKNITREYREGRIPGIFGRARHHNFGNALRFVLPQLDVFELLNYFVVGLFGGVAGHR